MSKEYTFDDLLDITTGYLNSQDLDRYIPGNGKEMDAEIISGQIVADIENGTLDELPPELEGNLFHTYDLWDFVYYFRKRYDLKLREEIQYKYWLSDK